MGNRIKLVGFGGGDLFVAVTLTKDIVAFGRKIGVDSDEWLHFRSEDWKKIKDFVDAELDDNAR